MFAFIMKLNMFMSQAEVVLASIFGLYWKSVLTLLTQDLHPHYVHTQTNSPMLT